jgi:hypothetical protein
MGKVLECPQPVAQTNLLLLLVAGLGKDPSFVVQCQQLCFITAVCAESR